MIERLSSSPPPVSPRQPAAEQPQRKPAAGRDPHSPLEDWFLDLLESRGVEERPMPSRPWWAPWTWFETDMHHKILLKFSGDGTIIDGQNVQQKAQGKGLPPLAMARCDAAIKEALDEAKGQRPPGTKWHHGNIAISAGQSTETRRRPSIAWTTQQQCSMTLPLRPIEQFRAPS